MELLYSTGADRLDRHQWSEAVDYFQEVERQHPYSEWSRRAILMQAYAHYQANNYAEAIADADRFISLYPGNPAARLRLLSEGHLLLRADRRRRPRPGRHRPGAGQRCARSPSAIRTPNTPPTRG